jgi:hypothetical protein
MANFWFAGGLEQIAAGTADWVSSTIKARLVSAIPASSITVMTDVTGIGDDQTLGTKSLVKDDTLACVKFVAANPTFPDLAIGSTIVGAVVYVFGTDDADSVPLLVGQIGSIPTDGGPIVLDWPTVSGTDGTVGYWHESADAHYAFTWSSVAAATDYTLKIGTSPSSYGLYDSTQGDVLTKTVALLPGTYYSIVDPSTTAEQTVVVTT